MLFFCRLPSNLLLAQFLHQFPEPFGYGDSQCSHIFYNTQAFIGKVEENHGGSQGFPGSSQKGLIQEVAYAHYKKDENFLQNPFETLGTGEFPLLAGGEDSGEVIGDHKDGEAYQKAVPAAEDLAEKTADDGKP